MERLRAARLTIARSACNTVFGRGEKIMGCIQSSNLPGMSDDLIEDENVRIGMEFFQYWYE